MSTSDPYRAWPPAGSSLASRTVDRRKLLAGAGAAVAAVGAGVAGAAVWLTRDDGTGPTPNAAAQADIGTPDAAASPPAAGNPNAQVSTVAIAIPDGMALVTSPRLPLFGVGGEQASVLLGGAVSDWREVGSAVGFEVVPLAVANQVPDGMMPAETVADYEALVAALNEQRGGVALVPVEQVDFRVNVLAVDGYDPLRHGGPDSPVVRVGITGGIIAGRNAGVRMRAFGDYTRPFHKIAAELSAYDLTISSMESFLTTNIEPPELTNPHTFDFVSDPAVIDGMLLAGIDAVTMANNHSVWNGSGWGISPFLDTIAALEAAGIPYFGAGRDLAQARTPFVATVKDQTIACFGIDGVTGNQEVQNAAVSADYVGAGPDSPGTNPFVTDQFVADIAAAAGQYDTVIVRFHMGLEYVDAPPQWVTDAAHAAIDAGATIVVADHPHVVQGMEIYAGKPILYSLGNFIFDQMFSVATRQGLTLEVVLRDGQIVGLRPKGHEIVDFHQPRPMTDGEQAAIMDRFWHSTDLIAGR